MRITLLVQLLLSLTLAGCGGGGGSSTKTTAVLKIGTQGILPAGVTGLSGVGVTISLPQGVTVTTDSNGTPTANVVLVSGVAAGGSLVPPVYTPPTATTRGILNVVVAAGSTLFGPGEFVTVTCKLPVGNALQITDFPVTILSDLQPADQLLQPVAGLLPTIAVTLH